VARKFYGQAVVDCLFQLTAEVEEDLGFGDDQRAIVELSLWQAISDLRLNEIDRQRASFIARRCLRLQRFLESRTTNPIASLLYKWSALLTPRNEKIRQLPGPFHGDISAVVAELLDAGLPRRARALASKFQLPLDPLVRWAVEHRPESEEIERTRILLERLAAPPQPVPYRVLARSRALRRVLSAPVDSIPMAVGSGGSVFIEG
jgi:hypothetical protein